MELDLEPLRVRMIRETERFLERNLPPRQRRPMDEPVSPPPAAVPHQYGPSAAARVARDIIALLTRSEPAFRRLRGRTGRCFSLNNELERRSGLSQSFAAGPVGCRTIMR